MDNGWAHTIKTSLSVDRLTAIIAKACRQPFQLEIEAHDFLVVPAYRIFEARFATVEDRDRTRIVLRQLEKEMIAAAKANPRRASEPAATAARTSAPTATPSPRPLAPAHPKL